MSWRKLEIEAPELARPGRDRLERAGLALLGTLRRDGSPRISPVEPHFARGHLLFAAMTRSAKERDLRRDPRCALHSIVADPEGADGELKLYGRAEEVEDELRDAARLSVVGGAPAGGRTRHVTRDHTGRLRHVEHRVRPHDVKTWSPDRGYAEDERPYP
jgi:Pyridoxamine 5'-phosphate oxidase